MSKPARIFLVHLSPLRLARAMLAGPRNGLIFGMSCALALSVSVPALAHSELRSSVPASGDVIDCPPNAIELSFSEGVQLTALRLYRDDGQEIDLPRRTIQEASVNIIDLPPLEPGSFRADWRVLSADGHPVGGTIAFEIKQGCAP